MAVGAPTRTALTNPLPVTHASVGCQTGGGVEGAGAVVTGPHGVTDALPALARPVAPAQPVRSQKKYLVVISIS